MAYELRDVLADPAAAARHLLHSGNNFGVEQAAGLRSRYPAVRLELLLAPLPALERQGYPKEAVRIVLWEAGHIHAFPRSGTGRAFKHRNPRPIGDLCLQYPGDDAALRWIPEDGLEPLVTLVHRHLIYEEAWRRSGKWPTEDAPHGRPRHGIHPLLTTDLQQERIRWAR